MVKGRLGMLPMSGTMRYSRLSLASASASPLASASPQTSGSSLPAPLMEITPQGMEEAHRPIPAKESPQYVHDDANPGANIIQAKQANAVPIPGGPSAPGVVLIPPMPQTSQEVAAYGAVPLVSIPHPQDTGDENTDADADADIQMTTNGTDATGENEGISSDAAGSVRATTNILLALFCTPADAARTQQASPPSQLMPSPSPTKALPVTHSHSCSHLLPIPPEGLRQSPRLFPSPGLSSPFPCSCSHSHLSPIPPEDFCQSPRLSLSPGPSSKRTLLAGAEEGDKKHVKKA